MVIIIQLFFFYYYIAIRFLRFRIQIVMFSFDSKSSQYGININNIGSYLSRKKRAGPVSKLTDNVSRVLK